MLASRNGAEMGVATLEYTPPHTKTVKKIVELCDLGMEVDSAMPTSIETVKEVMF